MPHEEKGSGECASPDPGAVGPCEGRFPQRYLSHGWVPLVQVFVGASSGMAVELRAVRCRWEGCGELFYLCQECDRGQRYCSAMCRYQGRKRSLQRARFKYAHSVRGRLTSRVRQRRFRQGRILKRLKVIKSVTDHSSQGQGGMSTFMVPTNGADLRRGFVAAWKGPASRSPGDFFNPPRCLWCGRPGVVMERASRRGRFRGEWD